MSQAGIVDVEGSHPQIPTLFIENVGTAVPIANTIEVLGAAVAAHGVPLQTVGSGNTIDINLQYSSSAASSVAGNAGAASFNSAQFTVDSNGFVSFSGAGAGETITGNTGGALSPTAGNWNILGTSTAAGTTPVQTAGSGSTLTIQVQKSQAIASTNATNVGLAAFDSAHFTVDANGFVTLSGSGSGETITGNDGNVLSPSSGNWNIEGYNSAVTGFSPYTTGSGNTMRVQMPGTAKWIVNATANLGTHTTIQAAITAASSGDTIFITPGTYTENLTLKAGVNLTAFACDISTDSTAHVIIVGKCTMTTAGTVSMSGIQLQTNSDFLLAVTGTAASIVNLQGCYLNCTNNTGISLTSNGGSVIYMNDCNMNLATTGIAFFACTSGGISAFYTNFTNNGSTTASTLSNAVFNTEYSLFASIITTTNNSGVNLKYVYFGVNGQTSIALTGTSSLTSEFCEFVAGSASAITVGVGCAASFWSDIIGSNNTNAIAGAGTITSYGLTFFSGSSSTIQGTLASTPHALTVPQGGTGLTSTTINQILYSSAANTIAGLATANNGTLITGTTGVPSVLANGTTGQILTATTGSPPSWISPATSGTVTSVSGTANQVSVATGTTTPVISLIGPYTPATYTAHGVLVGEGTSSIAATAVGSTGQILIGNTGADPSWGSITASAGSSVSFSTSNVLTVSDGGANIFIGASAGNGTLSGTANTGIGFAVFNGLTSGSSNCGIGYACLDTLTTGSQNMGVGQGTLDLLKTGSYNVAIGNGAGGNYTAAESSNILINSAGVAAESNVCRIGAANGSGNQNIAATYIQGISGVTVTGTAVLCSTAGQLGTIASSIRYKENVKEMQDDISVLSLRPVEFNFIKDEKKEKHYGLIAEEVHKDFPYLCFYNEKGEPESVLYHELPVFLLKEIKRLNNVLSELKSRIV